MCRAFVIAALAAAVSLGGVAPAATMAKLYTVGARSPRAQRLINRIWTRIKTGQ